jgi:hypothetical protein
MEMTMRKKILIMFVVPLIAALTAQAAAATERHHTRTKERAVVSERIRNSNAYAAPSNFAVQPGWSGYDGAMGSGTAGHWPANRQSAAGVRLPRFHETAGYPESAHSTRRTTQSVVVRFCQI